MTVGSPAVGFMAVVAVSGSVLYVSRRAHEQLLSDFMKSIECELGHNNGKDHLKKRVAFPDDIAEPYSADKAYRKTRMTRQVGRNRGIDVEESGGRLVNILSGMPRNRAALYRGMKEDRLMRGITH